jgi:sodium/bile acid cotransporter 7
MGLRFLKEQWFLCALACCLVIGGLQAQRWEGISRVPLLRQAPVAIVLFLMALPVPASQLLQAIRAWREALLAISLNVVALPLLAWWMTWGWSTDLAGGMIVAAVVPCTLASAALWTRRGSGNDSLAILVTIVTNANCFWIAPLWISLLMGREVTVQPLPMLTDLALLVLLPMALGQWLGSMPAIQQQMKNAKKVVGVICQLGILWMVLLGAIQMGLPRAGQESAGWQSIAMVVLVASAMHLAMLAAGWWASGWIGASRSNRVAVAIAGSQKTLMVGLKLGIDCGVSILPMVVYHAAQLLLDAVWVEWLQRGDKAEK